eukprot:Blabericola_migrator_1__7535@NODE_384_length_9129_cov_151_928272_g307_i0_p2_GENE_NODE_384_length_9129_cov_151_928272_g307_i0NODE_384_length_9129_cov_151_928272_g307_i0_p2_ORF_typecomplete_len516_score73_14MORN/PF02493_20/9_2e02MORN/PF02493_20/0_0064Fbox/PF00646_33/0_022_NODE_384_length_9129_cov_151_928272_g307_i02661813
MFRPVKRMRGMDDCETPVNTAKADVTSSTVANVLCSNVLFRIGSYLSSPHVFKLMSLSRSWYMSVKNDVFGPLPTPTSTLGEITRDAYGYSHVRVPLSYCSLVEHDGRFYWMDSYQAVRARNHRGVSMINVCLRGSFHKLSPKARLQFLWSLNFVKHLKADYSFFQCGCQVCQSVHTNSAILQPPLEHPVAFEGNANEANQAADQIEQGVADGTETPAVFAAFLVDESQSHSDLPEGSWSSPEGNSPIIGTVASSTGGSVTTSPEPTKTTPKKPSKPLPPPHVCEETAVKHSFDALTLAFQIAYRNRATLESIVFEGPPPALSTALKRDDELPKLPFPLKPKGSPTAVKPDVMPSSFMETDLREQKAETHSSACDVKAELPSHVDAIGQPPKFLKLTSCTFGPTVDCRYIVPFLDYSDFVQLNSVTVGRLTAEYSEMPAQFGEKATVVFAPQHIFNQQSFPLAPHLPALYNGAIDENLRFQGKGIFVCDEYTYEGEFRDGVNHGYGRMRSRAGEQ